MSLLDDLEAWARGDLPPIAETIDRDTDALTEAFARLGERGWLALKAPTEYDGSGLGVLDGARSQAILARYSGALAFLQTQHQSAAAMIATGSQPGLRERVGDLARGTWRVGIGYSHLRKQSNPPVTASRDGDGYRLSGALPWVTGAGIFDDVLVGATREDDGAALFCLLPLQNQRDWAGEIRLGEPMDLAAMRVTRTVRMMLDGWFVSPERVVRVEAASWMSDRDAVTVARKAFFAVGCARAGLDALSALGASGDVWTRLNALVEDTERVLESAVRDETETSRDALRARGRIIELAVRCAHAAVAASGGRGNLRDAPAQRIYREALLWTVVGQNAAVRAASLDALAVW